MTEYVLKNPEKTLAKVAREIKGKKRDNFNMGTSCSTDTCGTVACIGGHAWLVEHPRDFAGAGDFVDAYYYGGEYNELFFARAVHLHLAKITPEDAAKAIYKYLAGTRGNKIWSHVK